MPQGQGRGRGRSNNYRGGRGRGRYGSSQKKGTTTKSKDKEIKYYPHSKGQQQTYTYKMVTEHVLGFIQRRFDASFDVVESLRSGTVKTYVQPTLSQTGTATVQSPAPAPSTSASKMLSPLKVPSETTIIVATEEEKMIFKIEYDQYVKKKELYENNMIKAYATIFDYCSKTIQARIRESSDYESTI